MSESIVKTRKPKLNKNKMSRYVFCVSMALIPVVQYLILGLGVRLQSFLLAFQHYEYAADGLGYNITFAGFNNFVSAVEFFINNMRMVYNSFILFVITTAIGMSLSLVFSFYIYKKYAFSGLFKTVLFLPQIISGLIFATIFRYIVTDGYISIIQQLKGEGEIVLGLLDDSNTRFGMLIFFNIWSSFGVNVLMYCGAMSNINDSIVESAELDGVNIAQEFIHITIPLVYPTIVTFFVLNIVTMVTSDYGILNLLGTSAAFDIKTIGYWIYQGSLGGSYVAEYQKVSMSVLSACGLVLSLIILPITVYIKKLLVKYGPSVD